MGYRYVLVLLGCTLIFIGTVRQDWLLFTAWLGGDFLALGIAHSIGSHRVLGKQPDGRISRWGWFLFLPLLVFKTVLWHIGRLVRRDPALNLVTDDLVVGRRLLRSEVADEFENYVDLTAEFSEPGSIRLFSGYFCFPILDHGAPAPDPLHAAVGRLKAGRTFVHCAHGYGRTGLFALAVLLTRGAAGSVEDGLRILQLARPGIRLNRHQLNCIKQYAERCLASPSPPPRPFAGLGIRQTSLLP